MKRYLISLVTALSLFFASQVHAHYLWLTVDNYNPKPDEEIAISIGWGHKFGDSAQPRAAMVEKMKLFLIGPNGKTVSLNIGSNKNGGIQPIKVRLEEAGAYLAVLTIKTFVSKTVDGYFYKSKDELKDVIMSKWSETTAMAVINVGEPKGGFIPGLPKDCKYQIALLNNPATLGEGDILSVKLTFDGKPSRSWIYATYEGFSDFKDTFAWTTRTDKKGVAKIKVLKAGRWLIKSEYHIPYPEPDKAEQSYFVSTLTFEL